MNKRYLVILADRHKGRFFTIFMNTFENQGEEIADDVPQNVKKEHTRPGKVQQHIHEHLLKHLKHVGEKALDFLIRRRIKEIDGVIICGHQELLSTIRNCLPARLKDRVVAEIVSQIDVPIGELTKTIVNELEDLVK